MSNQHNCHLSYVSRMFSLNGSEQHRKDIGVADPPFFLFIYIIFYFLE